ncbi:MAG: type I DNA topoisomerase [bacterium]|jgi:DNA topoisomerase-1
MSKYLLIVESPAKAKTIEKFLGKNYDVTASMGHVRDLPRSQLGVDVDNNFAPKYITIRGKGEILKKLRAAAKKADKVFLASDPDREGEAIAWHLAHSLGVEPTEKCRVEFNEITKDAIKESIKNPRAIDDKRVDAQQARRILDRLVGYNLSPLLWEKVRGGLSAGRVQSVTVKLICDRQREIDSFVPEEYWSIQAELLTPGQEQFMAMLVNRGKDKLDLKNEAQTQSVVKALKKETFTVVDVALRERRRFARPPFTTSTLQQEAGRKLGFTVKKTMAVAQGLYEGLSVGKEGRVGLITYMRTDSTRISPQARQEAVDYISDVYGTEFVGPGTSPKNRGRAQDAHEGVRPTRVSRRPQDIAAYLTRDQLRLYTLIWERFLASQMSPVVFDSVTTKIAAGDFILRATGAKVKFLGYSVLYEETDTDNEDEKQAQLPPLAVGDELKPKRVLPKQHFTQPPAAYTEASLVKTLEELGIGRPSTYAPTIETITKRGYVTKEQKRLKPTELGFVVTDLLAEYFPEIVDAKFTAAMENQLDLVEEGEVVWTKVIGEFFEPFSNQLEEAKEKMGPVQLEDEESDEVCEQCGQNMIIKTGRFGKFLACPGFPECKNTKQIREGTGVECPNCGGEMIVRTSRRGRRFYGCDNYPKCSFVTWDPPTSERCSECGSLMVRKEPKRKQPYLLCSNKDCKHKEVILAEAADKDQNKEG